MCEHAYSKELTMNITDFTTHLGEKGISLSPKQLDQFELYFNELVEWNEKMNLTAITDKENVYLKHFYDSLSASFTFDFSQDLSIIDVGAGAGFPSLPLKICFPHLKISIVDSLNKRITFLQHLVDVLQLENVHLYHDRAETFAQDKEHRQAYDVAMARAVARLNVLTELCVPLVKVDGTFIAMKGAKGKEELEEAETAIHLLGGELKGAIPFYLPKDEGERNIILIHKKKTSPKIYPRKAGLPNKQPIT
jgi:16S rRNA (guanine527-N7)-methyltransferase